MISAHMFTGQRVVVVRHCVTVAFLTILCVCGMLGRPCQIDVGYRYCEKVLCVWVSWLCRTGFVALRRLMMTQGFPLHLWDPPPPRNLFAVPVCLRNVPHLYQFPDCLVTVELVMPLKASRLSLAMISRRKCSCTAVWCGIMPLSDHDLLYLFQWYRFIIVRTRWKASIWAIDGRPRLTYLYSDIYWSLWVLDDMASLWELDGVASRKC